MKRLEYLSVKTNEYVCRVWGDILREFFQTQSVAPMYLLNRNRKVTNRGVLARLIYLGPI